MPRAIGRPARRFRRSIVMVYDPPSFGNALRVVREQGRDPRLCKIDDNAALADMARAWGEECIDVLADVALNAENTASTRVAAAVALLDRGFGRPRVHGPDPVRPVVINDISMDQIMAARARIVDEC
jgi:hypothetical protein